MRLVEGFTLHKVLDEWLAIPGGESAARFSGLLSFNETGAFLFSLLQSDQSEESREISCLIPARDPSLCSG